MQSAFLICWLKILGVSLALAGGVIGLPAAIPDQSLPWPQLIFRPQETHLLPANAHSSRGSQEPGHLRQPGLIATSPTFQTLMTAEPGSITVVVVAGVPNPGGAEGVDQTSFEFDFSGTLGNFTVGVNTPQEFSGLAPGSYTIFQNVSAEWRLSGIYCDNGLDLDLPDPPQVTIDLQPGEAVSCTFANFANYNPADHRIFLPFVTKQGS